VHLSDVAGAVRAAVEQAHPGACPVYNVGSGVGSRLLDVVRYAEEVTGRRIEVEHTAQDAPPGLLVADVTLARKELGWEPVRSDLRTIVADAWACWPVRP
jgi:UDP-glucose 4-epimerase